MKNLLFLLIGLTFSINSIAQDLGIPLQKRQTAVPYYVWAQNLEQQKEMLGILYKVENDSFYTIPKAAFFQLEERFLYYPNSVSRNFLQAYPISDTKLKGYRKGRVYFYAILGIVAGSGVAVADVVQSHRKCNRDFFCNVNGGRNRRFSDLQTVGIGAAAGLAVGWTVGSIKIKIPLNDYPKRRRYTLFQELL